ncbi:MAG TPA: arginine--tRNA ligase, partial [Candidatus Binatia bacterium]|nr:arginine--tRNA ligase [Candidatus Binatia bacterium]
MKSLTEILTGLVGDAFEKSGYDRAYGQVVRSNRPDLGDFQCNGALAAAGEYGKNPRQIAQEVVDALEGAADDGVFAQVDLAGPGFVNLRLDDSFLAQHIQRMAQDERLGAPEKEQAQQVVIDFGGANVAKPMHVGHLRSSIIGDSLQRLFSFYGDEVTGDIHMGDWGLQMGMLITEVQRRYPDLPYFDAEYEGPYPAESPVTMADLQDFYPQASARAKRDPEAMEAARQATKELQEGRRGYHALWQHFVDVSIASLRRDFDALNVHFDLWLGESHADPYIEPMIERLKEEGYATVSEGALVVPIGEADDKTEIPPLMLLKSDGAALYGTTDLATLAMRMQELEPELILYVVDARQSLHFEQVFRAARKSGIVPDDVGLEHLPFGTMNGPDGKPFKTREGGVMRLNDLIEMVREKALSRLQEVEAAQEYDAEERAEIARLVGLSALKFADLVNHRAKDYVFDLERFSSFEGRTGPYLLYTAVRTKSILRRAEEQGIQTGPILPPAGAEERELMLKLAELPDVLGYAYETRA